MKLDFLCGLKNNICICIVSVSIFVFVSHEQVEVPVSLSDDRVVGEEDGVGPALRPGQLGEDDSGHAARDDHSDHTLVEKFNELNLDW